MSAEEPLAPGVHQEEVFPKLTPGQQARIATFAHERSYADGEVLWEQGDRDRPLVVVVEGAIAILPAKDHLVTVHEPGQFSGDVDILSGRPAVVRGVARGKTRVLEVPAARIRTVVQVDAELSEIFLRAFLLRRLVLMTQGAGTILLVGSLHSAGTLDLQEFLTRNGQPYAYVDVDREVDIQKMLDGFGVTADDVPIFLCQGTRRVLKKPRIEQVAECLGLNRIEAGVVHDVVIVGAGPGGLAAAVYAASEGLDAIVLEGNAPGGQAGSSSRIENYLGFLTGDHRTTAREQRSRPGGKIRSLDRGCTHGGAPRVRAPPVSPRARGRLRGARKDGDHRDRSPLSKGRPSRPRAIRRRGRLLRCDADRGNGRQLWSLPLPATGVLGFTGGRRRGRHRPTLGVK